MTLFAALCWKVLAFAMYAEGYDLDESAPVQVTGDEDIAALALLFGLSVPVSAGGLEDLTRRSLFAAWHTPCPRMSRSVTSSR
ncbi:hypothetical protein I2W78_27720 [Streptomyces spinoverrucosus]|uniref:hypothetical protein n=1 Tax=Streptomyces spinoverrucosus TaxID=284043 RepID=UPI0018C3D3C4|nr:hypothetical protein [Streptomyces spinoverrucosus]MBG0855530.1 hypothetical protein [Streptomyces spinoverrucosus]